MNNELKHIVEEFIQHYNALDVDKMLSLFTEDCIFENVSNSHGSMICHGKSELRTIATEALTLFKNRKQTITNWVIANDKIAVEIDYAATLAIDLPNGLKAGSPLNLKGVSIYEFEGNKIKRLVDFS